MSTDSAPKWRRLEPDERKEQIFSCAAGLFAERPYSEVSTSDIAAAAGVARGLINHYFGTKRELYLVVIRRALTVPHFAVDKLPTGSTDVRIRAAVEWFLGMLDRQGKIWLTAVAPQGIGRDPEVEQIQHDADRESSDRVLEAVGIDPADEHWAEYNALICAYAGMVKAAGREWLMRGSLDRDRVRALLTRTLLMVVNEMFPAVRAGTAAETVSARG
ncbi:TetR family transcriptional regulator [Amycolatopsis antarctica]|uniref:TetR family transcriptional regulator n=1 Tax=Amycolatopsis antarctica TaxID=1854586 RepID=A0A263D0D3_9PSEU|nr:TetR/AcrR family transcriptional regulator [Amycolatopsis antarctica]OZM71679.1 TetR family transcriptional regulator [Amycolatopsis antarctica]